MANIRRFESVIDAKQNEIEEKGLRDYYGRTEQSMVDKEIQKAYDVDEIEKDMDMFIACLERTSVPRFVRLAKFLREISLYDRMYIEYRQARLILRDRENKHGISDVKTLYKEYKQIEKDAKKTSKITAKILNKYKDVRNFVYSSAFDDIIFELKRTGLSSRRSVSELTNFFENRPELDFLYSSKINRKY